MLIGILLLLVTNLHLSHTMMELLCNYLCTSQNHDIKLYWKDQIVLEGSEDHYLRGSYDDTDSPSIPNVEECNEEMSIVGNLACSQDI